MPIHFSNPTCDVCGVRHAANHVEECRDQLVGLLVRVHEILEGSPELNMTNLDKNDAAKLNDAVCEAYDLLRDVPACADHDQKRVAKEANG